MADHDMELICPGCDYTNRRAGRLRDHFIKKHPEMHLYDLELSIVKTRNPDLDIDLLLVRYLDHKETVIGLQMQGIFVRHFLQNIGVARTYRQDKALMARMKRFEMGPELEFNTAVKRQLTWLKKAGVYDELHEIVAAMKLIKFTKQQLEKAKEPEKPKEPEDRLIGRFTLLYERLRAAGIEGYKDIF